MSRREAKSTHRRQAKESVDSRPRSVRGASPSKPPDRSPDAAAAIPTEAPAADDPGISLDELSHAFSEMLSTGDDPYRTPDDGQADPVLEAANVAAQSTGPQFLPDDLSNVSPLRIVEAALFVGTPDNRPFSSQQLASLMRGVRPAEVDELIVDLNGEYDRRNCPYRIISEGAGYRLQIRPKHGATAALVLGKSRATRLSTAAIEVLAAVAYKQPVTADQVSRLRGAVSSAVLHQLVRRNLIRVERTEGPPRTTHYWTTPRFLSLFGLNTLQDLPKSEDSDGL